jgi:hypothetical protein
MCWAFSFHDRNGCAIMEAQFPEIPGEAILFLPGRPESPLIRLKARPWFWWSGRYDVVDAGSGMILATLRRNGGIEGSDRRAKGRVINATARYKSLLEMIFLGTASLLFPQSTDTASLTTEQFRLEAGGHTVGSVRRVRLPFSPEPEADAVAGRKGWRRWLFRVRAAARAHLGGSGWQLDFSGSESGVLDERVLWAAALLHIQIAERYT